MIVAKRSFQNNLQGSVGLNVVKVLEMRIPIPPDLHMWSFIPLSLVFFTLVVPHPTSSYSFPILISSTLFLAAHDVRSF